MMDARWFRRWAPGGLVKSTGLDVRWMYMCVFQGVLRRLRGGPDGYPVIETGLKSLKKN